MLGRLAPRPTRPASACARS